MPFPGLLCVPPCLGAALVIYGGERVTTVGGRLLSTRPFLFIGAISYSLYLVHWPIVVFARLVRSDWEPWAFLAGGLGASIALAYLSYRFVEQPFRHNRTLFTRTRVFAAASVSIVLLISAAVYTVRHDGFPGRVSPDVRRILAYSGYPYAEAFREGTCFLRPDQTGKDLDGSCLPGPRPNLIMWGDSSLAQYYWGLAPLLRQRGISVGQLTASECPPIPTVDRPWRPNCKPFNDFALAQILKARPDIVVVGSVWAGISQEFAALDETIAKLTAAGIRVVVLGPPNIFTRPVPTILAVRRMAGNRDNAAGNDLDAHKSSKRDSMMRAHFQNYKNSNVSYVSVYHATCTPQCQIAVGDMPIHFDDFHLTRQGSELYASKLLPAIVGDQLSR